MTSQANLVGQDLIIPISYDALSGFLTRILESEDFFDGSHVISHISSTNISCASLGFNQEAISELIELCNQIISKTTQLLLKTTSKTSYGVVRNKILETNKLRDFLLRKILLQVRD